MVGWLVGYTEVDGKKKKESGWMVQQKFKKRYRNQFKLP